MQVCGLSPLLVSGNGASQAELRDGSMITVRGEFVSGGQNVFIQDGKIKVVHRVGRIKRWQFEGVGSVSRSMLMLTV